MGNIRRTSEEWLELYKQQRASGMTVKDWCAEKGIKLPTMADRITRLRKLGLIKEEKPTRGKNSTKNNVVETSGKKPAEVSWVEVKKKPEPVVIDRSKETAIAPLSISIGNFIIQVYRGFEPEVLSEVCNVLVAL